MYSPGLTIFEATEARPGDKRKRENLVIQETLKDTKVKNTKKEQLTLFIVYIIYYEIYFLNL